MSIDQKDVAGLPAAEPGHLERLAERLGGQAQVKSVFGEPVEREGITVIPVARASWGLGGGTSRFADGNEAGNGAGGGVTVRPVGYIELRDGQSRFRPVRDPASTRAILVAVGGVSMLLARLLGLRRARKRSKEHQ